MGWQNLPITESTGLQYYSVSEEIGIIAEELINFVSSWSAQSIAIFFFVFAAAMLLYVGIYVRLTMENIGRDTR